MATSKWEQFVRQCLLRRTHADEFRELAELMSEKHQTAGKPLIQTILECRQSFSISSDPLIPQYIRATLTSGLSLTSDVLYVLIKNWNSKLIGQGLSAELEKPGCLSSPDSFIINDLAQIMMAAKTPHGSSEMRKSLSLTSKWLIALIGWNSKDTDNRSYLAILYLLEALGILFVTIASTEQGMLLLGSQFEPDLKSLVVEALATVLPLMTSISVPLHNRLDMIQKQFSLFQINTTKEADAVVLDSNPVPDPLEFEANIVDEPNVHARASLYVYMNSALCGQPIVDDSSLIIYLNVRFAGDYVSMFIDIIVSVFDVLSNAQARNEGEHAINLCRSFLMNQLPPILFLISSSAVESIPAGLCISQALGRIDLTAFPLSSYDMTGGSTLAGTRQEFLFACALHRLIPEASVEDLLGENPMQTLPSHGLYEKDQLIQQIFNNVQRGEQLIREIESIEGNAGVVVAAVIEVMHVHCRNKATVPLMDLCKLIVRKPQIIDIMALFRSPAFMLGPLCSLLDNWNWDELHGESQPVYEEFGAIILLVLMVTHRHDLTPSEIGITSTTSFVRELLEMEAAEEALDDLDEAKKNHLGDWIAALFVADSLSDEVTSSCSPQQFYRLVPTLLHQSLEACASGKMSVETLKSRSVYLLEPFLLPSLMVGLPWLASNLWRTSSGASHSISLLQSLIKPPSSAEAREIHQTILSTVAEPLIRQLGAIASEDPQKQVAVTMANWLIPYRSAKRSIGWVSEDIKSLSFAPDGLLVSISHTFHQLLDWSTSLEVNSSPPKFSFKNVWAALHLHGALKVLMIFLKDVKSLIGTDRLDAGLDILTSIVCAPVASSASRPYLSLCDSVKMLRADLAKHLKAGDTLFAEAVVRLYLRVERYSAAISQAEMLADGTNPMAPDMSSIDLQNINLDAPTGNAEIDADTLGVQPTSEDIDQMLDGATGMENFGENSLGAGTDDIFGLDGGDMQMMNFDDMDLEGMF